MSHSVHLPSPPATRTRSRKISNDASFTSSSGNARPKTNGRAKTRSKQVEFNDNVEVQVTSPLPANDNTRDCDSELTDLTELEADMQRTPRPKGVNGIVMPSPRRLRSNGKETKRMAVGKGRPGSGGHDAEVRDVDRRITPMRKAKGKMGNLKEDNESVEEDEEGCSGDEDGSDEDAEGDEEGAHEDDEVDELASSPSPTPPPARGRRTPVKRRLRPRRVQTYTPPSDGDDEEEEEVQVQVEDMEEGVEESVDGSEPEVYEDAEEGPVITPRKLRNGKIVGDGDVGEEDEDNEEEDGEEEEEEEEFVDVDGGSIDIDETETEEDTDEPMEDGQFHIHSRFDV